jgi:hypothetical protein
VRRIAQAVIFLAAWLTCAVLFADAGWAYLCGGVAWAALSWGREREARAEGVEEAKRIAWRYRP